MSHAMNNAKPAIIDLLKTLASEAEQLSYEKNVPIADVPGELLCLWFDSIYHPTDKRFQSCFSPKELEALAFFNQFYDERTKLLPEEYTGIGTWLETSTWREIMAEAERTLRKIAPNQT